MIALGLYRHIEAREIVAVYCRLWDFLHQHPKGLKLCGTKDLSGYNTVSL